MKYSILPLKWELTCVPFSRWEADCPLGWADIIQDDGDIWGWRFDSWGHGTAPTADETKSACEAYYRSRLLLMLEEAL